MNTERDNWRPAPHGLRVVAWFVDLLVVSVAFASFPPPVYPLFFLLLFFAYHGVCIWLLGQTPGKALVGLEIKRIDKRRTLLWGLGRSSAGYLVIDVFGVGTLWAFFHRHHRCLHDLVFGSVVVATEDGRFDLRRVLPRLVDFANRHRAEIADRTKTIAALAAFWGSLIWLAGHLKKALDWLAGIGAREAGAPLLEALSTKAVTYLAIATTAVTGTVATVVPGAREVGAFLVTPIGRSAEEPREFGIVRGECPAVPADNFEELIEEARGLENPRSSASSLANLAVVLALLSEPARARSVAEEALKAAQAIEKPAMADWALQTTAFAFAHLGDTQRALEIARTLAEPAAREGAVQMVTWALSRSGEIDRALALVETLETSSARTHGLASVAFAIAETGNIDEAVGLWSKAIQNANAEEPLRRAMNLSILVTQAVILGIPGEFKDPILRSLSEAVAGLPDTLESEQILRMAAEAIHKLGDASGSRALLARSLRIARGIEYPAIRASSLASVAEAMAKLGDEENARAVLAESLETAESVEEGRRVSALMNIASGLVRTGDLDRSIRIAERIGDTDMRARVQQTIARTLVETGDAARAAEFAETIEEPAIRAQTLGWVAFADATTPITYSLLTEAVRSARQAGARGVAIENLTGDVRFATVRRCFGLDY